MSKNIKEVEERMQALAIRTNRIGNLITLYERYLNEALKYAKELAEIGVGHPWVNRTDNDCTTPEGEVEFKKGLRRGGIPGSRMRLEIR